MIPFLLNAFNMLMCSPSVVAEIPDTYRESTRASSLHIEREIGSLCMSYHRYLDSCEIPHLNSGRPLMAEFEGFIDEMAMEQAWNLVCSKYPVLCARVFRDDDGYLLDVHADRRPPFRSTEGNRAVLLTEVERPWDAENHVAELLVVRSEGGGFVAIRVDHAVVDGASLLTMVRDLWHFYTRIRSGDSISIIPVDAIPTAPTELLKARSNISESKFLSPRNDSVYELYDSVLHRVRLNKPETSGLRKTAHECRSTVHALLCGSIIATLRRHDRLKEDATMACWSMVDLRSRVSPQVGATETTNFLGFHRAQFAVPLNLNPIAIGRKIRNQLDSDSAKGELETDISRLWSLKVQSDLKDHIAAVSVSNPGPIIGFELPGDLRIVDLFVTYKLRTPVPFTRYGTLTYNGQLSIFACYPTIFCSTEVEEISAEIRDRLINLSGS